MASLAAGFMVMGTATTAQAEDGSVWVCKYVGQPDVDERLKSGKQPIAVSVNTIDDGAVVGAYFADAQGRSYVLDVQTVESTGPGNSYVGTSTCPEGDLPPLVEAVAPDVLQSSECDVEGSFTIPSTPGVQYFLDGLAIPAGIYDGPEEGTITASALSGYELTNPDFSFLLDVDPAEECETPLTRVTATNPTVVQSSRCDVEGSYTIPPTTGVEYLLDNVVVRAGTYSGPKTGVVTARSVTGYKLTNPDFSFALNVAPAADCYVPPPPPADLCSNIDGDQATVPDGYERDAQTNVCTQIPVPDEATAIDPTVNQSQECEVEGTYTIPATAGVLYLLDGEPLRAGTYDGPVDGVVTAVPLEGAVLTNPEFEFELAVEPAEACPAEVLPTEAVDVCPNLPGDQEAVPNGYESEKGRCVQAEEAEPKPPAEQPDEVLGTEAAVPTEVDAGLVGPIDTTGGSSLFGQALTGAGLILLVLAGTMQAGRHERGVHEA